MTDELQPRTEPHFQECLRPPRRGRRETIIWLGVIVALGAIAIVLQQTRMAVDIPMSGSVAASATDEGARHVVLVVPRHGADRVRSNLPVRLRVDGVAGWGLVVQVDRRAGAGRAVALAAVLGPARLRDAVAGAACRAHVLVGDVSTLEGLWSMATNRAPQPSRRDVAWLHERIPARLRDEPSYHALRRRATE